MNGKVNDVVFAPCIGNSLVDVLCPQFYLRFALDMTVVCAFRSLHILVSESHFSHSVGIARKYHVAGNAVFGRFKPFVRVFRTSGFQTVLKPLQNGLRRAERYNLTALDYLKVEMRTALVVVKLLVGGFGFPLGFRPTPLMFVVFTCRKRLDGLLVKHLVFWHNVIS